MVSAGILEISTKANSRAFTVISSPPPHVKIASTGLAVEKGGRLGRRIGGGRRIASLSAVPRIRTNIFPKQLDCIESEKDRQIERIRVRVDETGDGEVRRGRIVPRAMVPSGAGTAKGWRVPATPPRPSSLRLILFVSASRVRRTLQR